jgi:hypothetical protein
MGQADHHNPGNPFSVGQAPVAQGMNQHPEPENKQARAYEKEQTPEQKEGQRAHNGRAAGCVSK